MRMGGHDYPTYLLSQSTDSIMTLQKERTSVYVFFSVYINYVNKSLHMNLTLTYLQVLSFFCLYFH